MVDERQIQIEWVFILQIAKYPHSYLLQTDYINFERKFQTEFINK